MKRKKRINYDICYHDDEKCEYGDERFDRMAIYKNLLILGSIDDAEDAFYLDLKRMEFQYIRTGDIFYGKCHRSAGR